MQIYKKMDIGTAKILPEEMQGIRHHLVDVLMPDEEFNVVVFQEMAKAAMADIISRGKIPIVVGGTGFYIQALLNDIDFTENDSDMTFRHECEAYAKKEGAEALHDRLAQVDPESAKKIHANNVKRVIRALEFYEKTGTKISEHNEAQKQRLSPYNFAYLVLTMDRETLYERINRRVDVMMAQGLLEEVCGLIEEGYSPNWFPCRAWVIRNLYRTLMGKYPWRMRSIRLKEIPGILPSASSPGLAVSGMFCG